MILFCASVTQCVSYGLLLAAGTLMTATTRRYGWTPSPSSSGINSNQQPPTQRFLVKPMTYVTTSALEPTILAHYRPVYLSSAVNYPASIASPVAGKKLSSFDQSTGRPIFWGVIFLFSLFSLFLYFCFTIIIIITERSRCWSSFFFSSVPLSMWTLFFMSLLWRWAASEGRRAGN